MAALSGSLRLLYLKALHSFAAQAVVHEAQLLDAAEQAEPTACPNSQGYWPRQVFGEDKRPVLTAAAAGETYLLGENLHVAALCELRQQLGQTDDSHIAKLRGWDRARESIHSALVK